MPDPRRAIGPLALAVAGIGLLSGMDAAIKYLGQGNSPLAITFLRYVFGTAFAAAPLLWLRPAVLDRAAIWANLPRGFAIAVTAAAFFWSLSVLPLAEAITLTFIAPLLIPPMAQVLLKERMRPEALLACAAGFLGVIIALQGAPAAASSPMRTWGIIACLGSAFTYALSAILMRHRAERDGAFMVGLMGNLWPGLILAAPVLIIRPAFALDALPMMVVVGALGAAGLYLLSRAYALAQAQMLAAMEYTGLAWASLLGWAFFAEVPRWQTVAGAAVIATASLALAVRNGRRPA